MVKCGIIGCGVIAPTHISALEEIPESEVVALCDIKLEKAEQLAAKHHVAKIYRDYHALLADPEIDLVSICTDHASHAAIFVDALAAGKHVICEKSLGRTAVDLEQMVAAARRHPELVSGGIFQHRFEDSNCNLKKLIADGDFGKILTVNLSFNCLRTNDYYQSDSWRGTLAGEGGGVLINQAIHYLDQLRFIFGDVEEVCAKCGNLAHQGVIEVEDTAVFVMKFTSGVMAAVTATNGSVADWRNILVISGTKLYLEYANEKPSFIKSENEELRLRVEQLLSETTAAGTVGKSYYGQGHTAQLYNVVKAVRGEAKLEVDTMQAASTAALVMAVYRSSETGAWVKVAKFA